MSDYAPIVLFVYNRLNHTKQTIEALKKNLKAANNENTLLLETADDNYLYFIDKSLPFSNQVIYKDDNECLLNVRKIYTDRLLHELDIINSMRILKLI